MSDYRPKKKMRQMRMKAADAHCRLYYILRGILISAIITIPTMFAIAVTVNITDFPEEYVSPAVTVAVVLAIVLSSFFSSAWQKNCGWSNGSITGTIYACCILIIRFTLEGEINFNKDSITLLLVSALIGSVSGYVGICFAKALNKSRSGHFTPRSAKRQ